MLAVTSYSAERVICSRGVGALNKVLYGSPSPSQGLTLYPFIIPSNVRPKSDTPFMDVVRTLRPSPVALSVLSLVPDFFLGC